MEYMYNYHSHPRANPTATYEEAVVREQGKIATKWIENISASDSFQRTIHAQGALLYDRCMRYVEEHPVRKDCYKSFRIPKKSGGYRTLRAPETTLKTLQSDIAKFLTGACRFLPHNATHSYTKQRNCKTAMQVHQAYEAQWFLKLDLKDFFNNCRQDVLIQSMKNIFPLCLLGDHVLSVLVDVCTLNKGLPQGAPSSPVLSNIYMAVFDYELSKGLQGFRYTRYADDLIISSHSEFDFTYVIQQVKNTLPKGQHIKPAKTRYGSCSGRNWNLGLMYNQDKEVTVGFRNKHLLKNRIHNLVRDKDTMDKEQYRKEWHSLKGIIGYYRYIEPEYMQNLGLRYKEKGIEIQELL